MKKLLLLILLLLIISISFAQECVHLVFFYSNTCSACAQAEPIIDELEQEYNLLIDRREIHELGNSNLLQAYLSIYNINPDSWGIPATFLNGRAIVGYSSDYKQMIVDEITNCQTGNCTCPFNQSLADYYGAAPFPNMNETHYLGNNTTIAGGMELTIPVIVSAAIVDSINPCAFAVMIFLLTYLIGIGTKKRMLKIGFVYIATVFITYFLAGLGLFLAVQSTDMARTVYYVSAIVALVAGLINIKDFFWYGKGITLSIPKSAKSSISKWVKKASVPAAIVLGLLVSMFELPCTGGVYLAILGLLSNNLTKSHALLPLLLYNFIFVVPLIIMVGLVYFGVSAEKLEKWRKKKRNYMKLISGLLMIVLGILMLSGWI